MKKDELLTKLAMELAEFPTSILVDVGLITTYWTLAFGPSGIAFIHPSFNEIITEQDWIQRRRELINEPSDDDAPAWAEWLTQDSYGRWGYWKAEPFSFNEIWFSNTGECRLVGIGALPAGHDWRKTLRRVKRDEAAQVCSENEENHAEIPMDTDDRGGYIGAHYQRDQAIHHLAMLKQELSNEVLKIDEMLHALRVSDE